MKKKEIHVLLITDKDWKWIVRYKGKIWSITRVSNDALDDVKNDLKFLGGAGILSDIETGKVKVKTTINTDIKDVLARRRIHRRNLAAVGGAAAGLTVSNLLGLDLAMGLVVFFIVFLSLMSWQYWWP